MALQNAGFFAIAVAAVVSASRAMSSVRRVRIHSWLDSGPGLEGLDGAYKCFSRVKCREMMLQLSNGKAQTCFAMLQSPQTPG